MSMTLLLYTFSEKNKPHYIQNNPLLNPFSLCKSMFYVRIHTDLHMYDVIQEHILLVVKSVESDFIVTLWGKIGSIYGRYIISAYVNKSVTS